MNTQGDRIVTGGADGSVCCWDAHVGLNSPWQTQSDEAPISPSNKTKTMKRTNSKSPMRSSPNRQSSKAAASSSSSTSSPQNSRGKSPPRSSRSADTVNLPGMTLLKVLGQHKGPVTSLVTLKTKKGEILVMSSGIDTLVKVNRNVLLSIIALSLSLFDLTYISVF